MNALWLPVFLSIFSACSRPECAPADYALAECRVQAENELARATNSMGIEVRSQDPANDQTDSWAGLARVEAARDGQFEVRVAALGNFRLSVHGGPSPTPIQITIRNVHPLVEPLPGEVEQFGLTRRIEVNLNDSVVNLRGTLPEAACANGIRLVAVGDIQTNPIQFIRIIAAMHDETAAANVIAQPLMGMLLVGDLAESGTREEIEHVREILETSPIPTAVVPGNHDIYADAEPFYNQVFGPGNYAFDVCNTRIAMLDTGNGGLAESIQARLPEFLTTDARHLIAATHFPPYAEQTSAGWTREDQADHLMVELAARGADLMVAGHIHRRGATDAHLVRQVIVGTGGATQYAVDPDYGYLRVVLNDSVQDCFVPVPAPGGAEDSPFTRMPGNCE